MRRYAHIVQVWLGEQSAEEAVGVSQAILPDEGAVGDEPVPPVQAWQPKLSTAFHKEERVFCVWNGVYSVHHRQVQRSQLQKLMLISQGTRNKISLMGNSTRTGTITAVCIHGILVATGRELACMELLTWFQLRPAASGSFKMSTITRFLDVSSLVMSVINWT